MASASLDPFARFSWDEAGGEPDEPADDDDPGELDIEDSEEDDEAETVGAEFVECLLSQYLAGKMSAKCVCTLAWYASKAGAVGPATRLRLRPEAQSGQFAPKVDKFMGITVKKETLLHLKVPMYDKHDENRAVHEIPVKSPHEELNNEMLRGPSILEQLEQSVKDKEWAPIFEQHPIVRRHGGKALPVALYVDGFPFLKEDGAIGFYFYNLLTGVRHLACVLRKSTLCSCGCQGWCSIYPVFKMLQWSFEAGAEGKFPKSAWDGTEWVEGSERHVIGGTDMAMPIALVHIKGDWAEYASTFGFTAWSHAKHPCFICKTTKADMYNLENFSAMSLPHDLKTAADYERSCQNCEHVVRLETPDEVTELIEKLDFDDRKKGNHGFCLTAPIARLNLIKGDRLEPSNSLQDIEQLSSVELPTYVTFWRTGSEEGIKHRNPLFSPTIGVNIHNICVDQLHCLNLGVLKEYAVTVFWELLDRNVFEVDRSKAAGERHKLGVRKLRKKLFDWYKQRHVDNPDERIHEMQNLTWKMLGRRKNKSVRAKAGETKFLLFFKADMAEEYAALINNGDAFAGAGKALVTYMDICATHGRRLPTSAIQEKPRDSYSDFTS